MLVALNSSQTNWVGYVIVNLPRNKIEVIKYKDMTGHIYNLIKQTGILISDIDHINICVYIFSLQSSVPNLNTSHIKGKKHMKSKG